MQLIPAGLLALSVHLALALGQPVRSPAESSPERCMRATNAESGICMPQAAAPIMKMAHERKWIFMNAHHQDTDAAAAAAAPIDIEEADNSIQPILPPSPSPTASGIVTHTPVPVITSTFTTSSSATPTPTPTPPADYGEYSDYGDYGEYASYGDYDADVISRAIE